MSKLTAIQIRNAKPAEKPYKLNDGNGLFLYVALSGLKTWRYRFKVNKKESVVTLGEYPLMSLQAARVKRMESRELVKEGTSPVYEKKRARKATIEAVEAEKRVHQQSFEWVAHEWMSKQKGRWSHNHAQAVYNSLKKNVFPYLGDKRVDTITPPMVLQVLRKMEESDALTMAAKVLQRITAVLRYAVQVGLATVNPATE
ncbi:MAG: integrase arm-type DNA-binding domain-containing protein, partial [Deltaproteobacteria bacterium]|nr:integrase arm-type DNA-binding domain-containing protein [Deltaproteobacteria bacterium]